MVDARDPIMAAVQVRFGKSKLTLDELGLKMGYPRDSAEEHVAVHS